MSASVPTTQDRWERRPGETRQQWRRRIQQEVDLQVTDMQRSLDAQIAETLGSPPWPGAELHVQREMSFALEPVPDDPDKVAIRGTLRAHWGLPVDCPLCDPAFLREFGGTA